MDTISEQLVGYASRFSADDLSEAAVARATDLLFDSLACAVAGSVSEPAAILERLAAGIRSDAGATIYGSGLKTSPEIATLANTTMIRTYDFNDAYYGHPSDMIAGILAAAEMAQSSGMDVLTAIALAYEVFGGFARTAPYHLDSWADQGLFMSVGVALAAGKLWGLDEDRLANAASLALVPNLPLGVSRWGALSMMKGSATAFSVRSGIFAAMLAKEGFTSSPDPYEGQCGLFDAIGRFELQLPVYPQMRIVEMSYIKPIPAENNTIGVLECAPEIRDRMAVDDIESIDIELATGLDEHLADEAKYDPKTRESADHSFPFMLARALVDGGISFGSYTAERIADPAIRPLMQKIRVRGNADMKAMMTASRARDAAPGPEAKPARVRVTSVTGEAFTRELLGHSGHPQRPAQERRRMLDRKLDLCARHAGLSDETREQIRRTWWEIRSVRNIGEAIGTLTWR